MAGSTPAWRRISNRTGCTRPPVAGEKASGAECAGGHYHRPVRTLHAQVVVVGGGHAGVEAAWAAANLLADAEPGSVLLVSLDPTKIGVMSCNPAIGGLAKGQLVREIDALGGLMGLATDATGIQFRVLNTSKGPAVHGPRAQCDKHAYAEAVQSMIASRREIRVIAGSVEGLLVEGDRCVGVRVAGAVRAAHAGGSAHAAAGEPRWDKLAFWPEGEVELRAPAVVLTTGTFMRGLMHTGEQRTEGGRYGEAAARGISASLEALGFELGRLKTGTPPRLRRGSIRWNELSEQKGDERPVPFSDLSGVGADVPPFPSLAVFPVLRQVSCRETATNEEAHRAIRENLHRAPMYSGQIESTGPRYCPSIEDKVVRFAERDSHGVFLEPESLRDDWVYCNGISTSLPADVQDRIVRSMPGCEAAEILRYGYAVEYDMVRPHQIDASAMTRRLGGLFLAGQINGTSGYEEAAAQGLVAGLNAARHAGGQRPVVLGRETSYIGVLMDDLVTKTPVEPYRMFTSRAEHRLTLRADNAPDRLTPLAKELGLLGGGPLGALRVRAYEERCTQLGALHRCIEAATLDGEPLSRVIRGQALSLSDCVRCLPEPGAPEAVWRTAYADLRYAGYMPRVKAEIRRQREMEDRRLPDDVPYESLTHLRTEARQALSRFRPRSFGQASRLEGITPADLTLLSVLVDRWQRSK
ncbi:MAG: tRNA uridine-5-carboxymethylaminomethyl(34) synthesis enzyme MnmG [Leptolyngbya sp. PLA1]|nr:tRNA uridine-5-carboxymethylaminomethyl(34) synthesis enzyme MnmG [Leptolyngbya sp. PLA1]